MGKENMNIQAKVGGKFKLVVRRGDGSVKQETGWIKNTITNIGLNRMGTGVWFDRIGVGSGSTPPTVDDVWLESQIAVTTLSAPSVPSGSVNNVAPYEATAFIGRRFSNGQAAGNISEVIAAWGETSGTAYARQLVRDEFGAPATITVLSDETLDVYYGISLYPPYEAPDQTGDFVIGPSTHAIVMRAAKVGVSGEPSWLPQPSSNGIDISTPSNTSTRTSNGEIGNVFGEPSLTASGLGSVSNAAYANNSFERTSTFNANLNDSNLPGGVSSMRVKSVIGVWQIGFTPPIPKDDTKVMSLTFKVSWARYVA